MKKDVLGVKIDDITENEAVDKITGWLLARQGQALEDKHYIVTPNPEFVVAAQNDPEFKEILNKADLSIPDGVGLKLLGVKNRVTGVDLMEKLCDVASQRGFSIGLIGGRDDLAKLAAEKLKDKYTGLKITVAENGGEVDDQGRSTVFAVTSRNFFSTDLLFVAFGHIKQEKWINNYLDKIPVKVAMGVGGSFGYISGIVPRAPVLIRNLGLEWLFRLILQPWRIKRQFNLIKFIWLVFNRAL